MPLRLTPIPILTSREPHSILPTARVRPYIRPKLEKWFFRVIHAMIHLSGCEHVPAYLAFVCLQPCPELPKYSAPGNSVGLEELDEGLDVPAGVCLVLSDLSSVHVY